MIELTTGSAIALAVLILGFAVVAVTSVHRLDRLAREDSVRGDAEDGARDMLGMLVLTLTAESWEHSITVPHWVIVHWYAQGYTTRVEYAENGDMEVIVT